MSDHYRCIGTHAQRYTYSESVVAMFVIAKFWKHMSINRRLVKLIMGHLLYNEIQYIRQKFTNFCICYFGKMFRIIKSKRQSILQYL